MEVIQQMKSNIDNFISEGFFDNKRLAIFGANTPNSMLLNYLYINGYNVESVVDNSTKVQGTYFMDLKVQSPMEAFQQFDDSWVILIASQFYEEMKSQLEEMGYKENLHIFKVATIEKKLKRDLSLPVFEDEKLKVLKGFEIYKSIQIRYPNSLVIMSPYKPNGDIYIICSYLCRYIERHKKNIVLTAIGNAAENTAKMFPYENIVKLTEIESSYLGSFAKLMPHLVEMINPHYWHSNSYRYIDGYKGLNFVDMIKLGLLNLNDGIEPIYPIKQTADNYVDDLINEHNLIEGKTIILAPHVNSLVQIKWALWEKLTEYLKALGYIVCTNCGPSEREIKGTIKLVFPFDKAVDVCNRLGYVIAYRSGFCEIIANSSARKIVIYPNKQRNEGFMTEKEYFTLTDKIYDDQLLEVVNNYNSIDELLQKIMNIFEED